MRSIALCRLVISAWLASNAIDPNSRSKSSTLPDNSTPLGVDTAPQMMASSSCDDVMIYLSSLYSSCLIITLTRWEESSSATPLKS